MTTACLGNHHDVDSNCRCLQEAITSFYCWCCNDLLCQAALCGMPWAAVSPDRIHAHHGFFCKTSFLDVMPNNICHLHLPVQRVSPLQIAPWRQAPQTSPLTFCIFRGTTQRDLVNMSALGFCWISDSSIGSMAQIYSLPPIAGCQICPQFQSRIPT